MPEPEREPDFSLISNRQQPLADPEQPGGVTRYLEQVEQRLQGLEGAAKRPPSWPMVRLSGFFQLTDDIFSQSAASQARLGNIQNGVGFRRTRLQAIGKLSDFTAFSIEMDFAVAGRPSFMDVWGEQSNLGYLGTIRVGQFRQPISMDSWTSVRHLDMIDRSLPFQAFDEFRRVGIMSYNTTEDERTQWAASVFSSGFTFLNPVTNTTTVANSGIDDRYGTQLSDFGGVACALRATHLLYYDEPSEGRYLLHIGGGYTFNQLAGNPYSNGPDANTYQARPIPEAFVGDLAGGFLTVNGTPAILDSGRIRASGYNMWHTELAGNYGAAHFQTEWMVTALNQTGGPVIYMPGAYLQGGYFLTGESAAYNKQAGVMDYNVVPYTEFFGLGKGRGIGGWGAWEVTARWSYVDLTCHGARPIATQTAALPNTPNWGVANESTVGLNWWWNRYTRLQINWIHSMPNYQFVSTSPGLPVGLAPFDIFVSQFQIEF